jgi:FkbM family methyltransferase
MKIHGLPAARFIASRLLWATRLSPILTMKAPGGCTLRFYPSSISAMMWCKPDFYRNDEAVLRKYLRSGSVFVDCGANIGVLSLLASKLVGETGRVFSIEAHPRTVEFLRGNVKLNNASNVTVIHAAVGDHEGEVQFSSRRSDDQNGVAESGIKVPLRTLDSLVPDAAVRLLKIDVEGFELFALRGASRVLKTTEMVYFESWESHFKKYGYSTPDVLTLLADRGFDAGVPKDYKSELCENLLATQSKRGEVGSEGHLIAGTRA